MKNLFPFCFLITAALISCDANTVYTKNDDNFPQFRWEKGRAVVFEPTIEDVSVPYDIMINFRHVNGFQYADMQIRVVRISPSGEETSKEFDFPVVDGKGDYLSECALDICDLETDFETGAKFEETGKYTYKISHLMPPDPLPNVMEVGLVVRKSGL